MAEKRRTRPLDKRHSLTVLPIEPKQPSEVTCSYTQSLKKSTVVSNKYDKSKLGRDGRVINSSIMHYQYNIQLITQNSMENHGLRLNGRVRVNARISVQMRQKLVQLVINQNKSLIQTSEKLGIKLSTAKLILKRFKKNGTYYESNKAKASRLAKSEQAHNRITQQQNSEVIPRRQALIQTRGVEEAYNSPNNEHQGLTLIQGFPQSVFNLRPWNYGQMAVNNSYYVLSSVCNMNYYIPMSQWQSDQ